MNVKQHMLTPLARHIAFLKDFLIFPLLTVAFSRKIEITGEKRWLDEFPISVLLNFLSAPVLI
jgi:hypothetical protein